MFNAAVCGEDAPRMLRSPAACQAALMAGSSSITVLLLRPLVGSRANGFELHERWVTHGTCTCSEAKPGWGISYCRECLLMSVGVLHLGEGGLAMKGKLPVSDWDRNIGMSAAEFSLCYI